MDAGASAQTKKTTMAVIFIALLHAAPVFLIGIHTKSRGWLIASAVVSGILAVNFGGDRYVFVDLLAIGVTVIWCWIALATAYPKEAVTEQVTAPVPDQVPNQEPELCPAERDRLDLAVERVKATYPQLNPARQEYDRALMAEVLEEYRGLLREGTAPYRAFQRAVSYDLVDRGYRA